MRLRATAAGWLFGLYLVLAGAERWISELFRIRPDKFMGMSVAQWLSLAAICMGALLLWRRGRREPA
jgi:phosphatidylglycerol:prolipoprotein diacylglycerol transferase